MITSPQEAIIKATIEVALERFQSRLIAANPWSRFRVLRIARAVGTKLDDIIANLQPCFKTGEYVSIQQVFYDATPIKDQLSNYLYRELIVLGAWFNSWDDMRIAIGRRRTAHILVQQIRTLYDLLIYAGRTMPEVTKAVAGLPPDDHVSIRYQTTRDWYNRFLTDFEALLRRFPEEVGILDPPVMGSEHFFVRL